MNIHDISLYILHKVSEIKIFRSYTRWITHNILIKILLYNSAVLSVIQGHGVLYYQLL